MCFHLDYGSSASKGVHINTGEPQNWGALGLATLLWGAVDPEKCASRHVPNLVVLGQMV